MGGKGFFMAEKASRKKKKRTVSLQVYSPRRPFQGRGRKGDHLGGLTEKKAIQSRSNFFNPKGRREASRAFSSFFSFLRASR